MPGRPAHARVEVVVERRYLEQEQPAATVRALRELGQDVRVVLADDAVVELGRGDRLADVDLVVGRGRSDALLCSLAMAERAGVPAVNSSDAVRRVVHKEITGIALGAAGLPVPPTWLLPVSRLAELPASSFPLVVKPHTGDNGRGIRVLGGPEDVDPAPAADELVLAQTLVPFDGEDLKLYVVGDHVVATRKPSPLLHLGARAPWASGFAAVGCPSAPARPWRLTPELRGIAMTCAALTGLDLLGVDLVLGPDGPVVVEVNDFPNYSAVPEAGRRIADHLLSSTGRAVACASAC